MSAVLRIPVAHLAARSAGRGPHFAEEIARRYPAVDGVHIVPAVEWYAIARTCRRAAAGPRGLGDLVHAVAHPIARALDAALGTDLQHCPDCARRRAEWNRRHPLPPR